MAKKRKPRRNHNTDADWMLPMQVAAELKIGYQTARNRMLKGTYGEPLYDEKSGKLYVRSATIHAIKAGASKPAPRRRPKS